MTDQTKLKRGYTKPIVEDKCIEAWDDNLLSLRQESSSITKIFYFREFIF